MPSLNYTIIALYTAVRLYLRTASVCTGVWLGDAALYFIVVRIALLLGTPTESRQQTAGKLPESASKRQ